MNYRALKRPYKNQEKMAFSVSASIVLKKKGLYAMLSCIGYKITLTLTLYSQTIVDLIVCHYFDEIKIFN